MSKRLDPKGLQGAFARRTVPAGGLDFLIPPRPPEPEAIVEELAIETTGEEGASQARVVRQPPAAAVVVVEPVESVESVESVIISAIVRPKPRRSAFDPAVPPLPEPPRFQRFVLRPAERWIGIWLGLLRRLPR